MRRSSFSVSPAIKQSRDTSSKLSEYMLRKEEYLPTRALSRQHLWSVLGYVNLIFFAKFKGFEVGQPFGFCYLLGLGKFEINNFGFGQINRV